MELAGRLKRIKPSSTLAVTAKVLELKAAGKKVIGFAAGEPDFDTWPHVCEAARQSIARGDFRYTAVGGTPELKEAIITKLARDNGLSYEPSQVIASCGGKHSLYNALQTIVDPGDEVVIIGPYWVSYADLTAMAEGVPKVVMAREDAGFKLGPDELELAIGPKTKLVIINSPSNPTGATYTEPELEALAKVLVKHDVWVLTDDVYEFVRYDGERPRHLVTIEPSLAERTLVVNSVSKTYAMTGWRIGYTAAPAPVIKAMATIQGQSTSNPSAIAQAAAAAALAGDQSRLGPMVEEFRKRRDYICERINAIDGLSVGVPQGAFYVFVNASGVFEKTGCRTSDELALAILDNALVGLVGGTDFGSSDHFRISYATSLEQIEQGMDNIENWLGGF